MVHVWQIFAGVPEAEDALARIVEFVRKKTG